MSDLDGQRCASCPHLYEHHAPPHPVEAKFQPCQLCDCPAVTKDAPPARQATLTERAAILFCIAEVEQLYAHDPYAPVPAWIVKYALAPHVVDEPPEWHKWVADVDSEDVLDWSKSIAGVIDE